MPSPVPATTGPEEEHEQGDIRAVSQGPEELFEHGGDVVGSGFQLSAIPGQRERRVVGQLPAVPCRDILSADGSAVQSFVGECPVLSRGWAAMIGSSSGQCSLRQGGLWGFAGKQHLPDSAGWISRSAVDGWGGSLSVYSPALGEYVSLAGDDLIGADAGGLNLATAGEDTYRILEVGHGKRR